MYRAFKQFTINYKLKQKALEMRRRSYPWSQMSRPERRRQFQEFSTREREIKVEPGSLAFGKQLKTASLNVRSLKVEQAEIKRKLLVDIMARNGYDILLLQETNVNRNCVEKVDGCKFFFSTDVKEQEVVATQKRLDDALATAQRTDIERAGVGIILSKKYESLPT